MLHNPNWKKPTPEDFLEPHLLLQWLETMPPDEKYCFKDPKVCALGQYLTHCGFSGRDIMVDVGLDTTPSWYARVVQGSCKGEDYAGEWTFGQAADRCREVIARG